MVRKALSLRLGSILFLLMFLASVAGAQVKTTISDTLHAPDGSPVSGKMTIRAHVSFTAADGTFVGQGIITNVTLLAGVFTVQLVPNENSNPDGTYYDIEYNTATSRINETWIVPISATPLTLVSVRAINPFEPAVNPIPGGNLGDVQKKANNGKFAASCLNDDGAGNLNSTCTNNTFAGKVKAPVFANTAIASMTGATPSVTGGNKFKTANGSPTTVTNFTGGIDSQQLDIFCGDANTTFQNNATIVTFNGADFTCAVDATISFIYFSSGTRWVQLGAKTIPVGSNNAYQKKNGLNFAAACTSDDGTVQTVGCSGGQRVTGPTANSSTITMTGATPAVSGGNVFKTNNGAPTTVTNFTGGVSSQAIQVICGDANTTIQNNANIGTASGADIACALGLSLEFIFDSTKWIQGSGAPAVGADNTYQKKSGQGFTASCSSDDGTTQTVACSGGQRTAGPRANTSITTLTGATPSVAGNNVFKTNNGGATTITNFTGGVTSQTIYVICGDTNTIVQNNANIGTTSGTDITCSLNLTSAFVYDSAQTKWLQSGSAGGGANPLGNNGDLQMKNGVALAASAINDDGTTVDVNRDVSFKGSNPHFDIRAFGARAFTGAVPSTTGTVSAGSAVVTLANGASFQNGDGITLVGAGTTLTVATPAAPTVSASNAAGGTGTGIVVANASGATTYCYSIAARTKDGQLTPVSPETCITNGDATMGLHTGAIDSFTRVGGTITVTTSAAHNLVVGALARITGASYSLNGEYKVQTVPDNTHFTISTASDAANFGTGDPSPGGTVQWYTCNHVSWPTLTNAHQFYVYGRTTGAGTKTLLGISYIQNSAMAGNPTHNAWDDFGTTMGSPPSAPDWVPTTDSSVAKNGNLTTTIVSGGGTNTVTLAATATNAVAGTKFVLDNVPNILAAANAVAGNQKGILYIPATSSGLTSFSTYSYLSFPANIIVNQASQFALGDTMQLAYNGNTWKGLVTSNTGAMQWVGLANIVSSRAFPMIYSANGAHYFSHVTITNLSLNSLGYQQDAGGLPNSQFDHVQFVSTGANDYLGINATFRNQNPTGGPGDTTFDHCVFYTGMTNGFVSDTPLLYFTVSGSPVRMTDTEFNIRSMFFDTTSNGLQLIFENGYIQGGMMPLMSVINRQGGTAGMDIQVNGMINDTTNQTVIDVLGGVVGTAHLRQIFGNLSMPAIIAPYNTVAGSGSNIAQGFSFPYISLNAIDGVISQQRQTMPVEFHRNHVAIGPANQVFVQGSALDAPTCVVSAGGSVAVNNTFSFSVAPVYATRGQGPPSLYGGNCTTSSGNQTITISWTPIPNSGVVGYNLYYDNGNINSFQSLGQSPLVGGASTSSFVWTNQPTTNGGGAAGSGPTSLTKNALYTPNLILPGLDGTTATSTVTINAPTITTGRTVTLPDASGQIFLVPAGQVYLGNHLLATNSSGQQIDYGTAVQSVYDSGKRAAGTAQSGNANWTASVGTVNINSSGSFVGGGAGNHLIAYTGASFPGTDQTSAVTVSNTTTGANAAFAVSVYASATADTSYNCAQNAQSPTVLNLTKIVAGSTTVLLTATYQLAIGDRLSLNINNGVLNCYVNGALKIGPQSDASITSGYPGIRFFGNNTFLTFNNFSASFGGVSLNMPQTWRDVQTASAAGGWDASAATSMTAGLRMPNAAAAAPTTAGALAYDTTNKNVHVGANAVDNIFGLKPAATTVANDDCVKWTVTGAVITLNTAGVTCGGGSAFDVNATHTWGAIQSTGAAGGWDSSASTSLTAGLRMPNTAGANPATAGALAYDTTNKNVHVGANTVDNIFGIKPAATSVANNDCVKWTVSSGVVTLNTTGSGCAAGTVTPSSSDTFTNKTLDAEGTGNVITIPFKPFVGAALCNNATAAPAYNLPTSSAPTANCNTGTNVQEATLDFADLQTAQFTYMLPSDWTGAIDARALFFNSSTSGTVIWSIATACADVNGSQTDDIAFNTANNFGTVTLGATANGQWTATVTGITTTGCAAGEGIAFKIKRETDTAANVARLKGVELTIRRAL